MIAESGPAAGDDILSPTALPFLADLARAFRGRIASLRGTPKAKSDRAAYGGAWKCAPIPALLSRPRVDLIGPPETAAIVSALASSATAFVADMDEAMLPSWPGLLEGQALLRNLNARVRRHEHLAHAAIPPVILRPRSLFADEEHLFIDAEPVPAGLVDVGLYCFHNAAMLSARVEGPWISLTQLRGRVDARLWSDIAVWLEQKLGVRQGSIRFGLRIDTVSALEELDRVLWTLRSRVLSVACGRFELLRDLIGSAARRESNLMTPARSFLTVDRAPLGTAAARLLQICRQRGVQVIGPTLTNTGVSRSTYARTYASALRQARCGFDGTQLVDPKLIPVARAALVASASGASTSPPRFERPTPPLTEAAVRENIEAALIQLTGAFGGQPRIALDASLEDCASARAARAQLWSWLHARIRLGDDTWLDKAKFTRLVQEESKRLGSPPQVRARLEHICTAGTHEELSEREERLRRDLTCTPENTRELVR